MTGVPPVRRGGSRVKVKAPKSGSERLEMVLDGDGRFGGGGGEARDDASPDPSPDIDAPSYGAPDDREGWVDDGMVLYNEKDLYRCPSSHSASTAEADNRTSSSSGGLVNTWSIESSLDDDASPDDDDSPESPERSPSPPQGQEGGDDVVYSAPQRQPPQQQKQQQQRPAYSAPMQQQQQQQPHPQPQQQQQQQQQQQRPQQQPARPAYRKSVSFEDGGGGRSFDEDEPAVQAKRPLATAPSEDTSVESMGHKVTTTYSDGSKENARPRPVQQQQRQQKPPQRQQPQMQRQQPKPRPQPQRQRQKQISPPSAKPKGVLSENPKYSNGPGPNLSPSSDGSEDAVTSPQNVGVQGGRAQGGGGGNIGVQGGAARRGAGAGASVADYSESGCSVKTEMVGQKNRQKLQQQQQQQQRQRQLQQQQLQQRQQQEQQQLLQQQQQRQQQLKQQQQQQQQLQQQQQQQLQLQHQHHRIHPRPHPSATISMQAVHPSGHPSSKSVVSGVSDAAVCPELVQQQRQPQHQPGPAFHHHWQLQTGHHDHGHPGHQHPPPPQPHHEYGRSDEPPKFHHRKTLPRDQRGDQLMEARGRYEDPRRDWFQRQHSNVSEATSGGRSEVALDGFGARYPSPPQRRDDDRRDRRDGRESKKGGKNYLLRKAKGVKKFLRRKVSGGWAEDDYDDRRRDYDRREDDRRRDDDRRRRPDRRPSPPSDYASDIPARVVGALSSDGEDAYPTYNAPPRTPTPPSPRTEYRFEGYDHIGSRDPSPLRDGGYGDGYGGPTAPSPRPGTVSVPGTPPGTPPAAAPVPPAAPPPAPIATNANPWAAAGAAAAAGVHPDPPGSPASPADGSFDNAAVEVDVTGEDLASPAPDGSFDFRGAGMPSVKWWTWRQPDDGAGAAVDQNGESAGEDCTYFAFLCMFPPGAQAGR